MSKQDPYCEQLEDLKKVRAYLAKRIAEGDSGSSANSALLAEALVKVCEVEQEAIKRCNPVKMEFN